MAGWRLMLAATVLVSLAVGCRRAAQDSGVGRADDVRHYADLPLLRETHHPELQAELARLISEGGTPALLNPLAGNGQEPASAGEPPPNTTAALEQTFPEKLRVTLEKRLSNIYPPDRFEFNATKMRAASVLLEEYAALRQSYRELVGQGDHDFQLEHARGLGADTSFVDAVRVGNRLEALAAAEAIEHGLLEGAIESLDHLFRMVELLARESHVVPRVAAVHLRDEALHVMEAIAEHPQATAEIYAKLLARIEQQLATWPPDAKAWIGERAQGAHTYELIRDGYLLSVLSYEEIRQYRDEVGIDKLGTLVAKNIDVDELFYLQTMRRVIESCEQPFSERESLFRAIDRQLEASRESMDYPFVADQLLLTGIVEGQRWQAVDRARCAAWQLALATATGHRPDKVPVNPLTGYGFILEVHDDRVIVDAIDPARGERPIILRPQ